MIVTSNSPFFEPFVEPFVEPFGESDIPDTGIPRQAAAGMTMAERFEWHQSYLRRHRVSRRIFLAGSAAAAS